jgi:hypothetical protein
MILPMSGPATIRAVSDGYWAEAKSGNEHLRAFVEAYSVGYLAGVYDENRRQKVAQDVADDIEEAMRKAEELAARYLRYRGTDVLLRFNWQLNPPRKVAS